MDNIMVKQYTNGEFRALLSKFQDAIDKHEYTEKIPYDTWRKLMKLHHPKIEYISPFVKVYDVVPNINDINQDVIIYSAKTYDWGFGRFFYDYFVKKENQYVRQQTYKGILLILPICSVFI